MIKQNAQNVQKVVYHVTAPLMSNFNQANKDRFENMLKLLAATGKIDFIARYRVSEWCSIYISRLARNAGFDTESDGYWVKMIKEEAQKQLDLTPVIWAMRTMNRYSTPEERVDNSKVWSGWNHARSRKYWESKYGKAGSEFIQDQMKKVGAAFRKKGSLAKRATILQKSRSKSPAKPKSQSKSPARRKSQSKSPVRRKSQSKSPVAKVQALLQVPAKKEKRVPKDKPPCKNGKVRLTPGGRCVKPKTPC